MRRNSECGLLLKFVAHEDDEDQDEDDVAEETAEWGAFGFLFTLGVLSFGEAKPRNQSSIDYQEKDEFTVADFMEGIAIRARRTALRS